MTEIRPSCPLSGFQEKITNPRRFFDPERALIRGSASFLSIGVILTAESIINYIQEKPIMWEQVLLCSKVATAVGLGLGVLAGLLERK